MTHWRGAVSAENGGRAAHWLYTSRWAPARSGPVDPVYGDLNLARHVGDDPERVERNRKLFGELTGCGPVTYMMPMHGNDVAYIGQPTDELLEVDALVTDKPDVPLAALGADCIPVALVDPEAGVIGAAHSGWRGLVANVTGAAIDKMVELGADRSRIRATLGPAICGKHFPLPAEDVAKAAAFDPAAESTAIDGSPSVDIRAGLVSYLNKEGISVELVGRCTHEDPHMYSYRRDGVTGRHGVAVWWSEPK